MVILSDCRMVLLKPTIAGIGLILLAVVIMTYGPQHITMQTQEVRRTEVEPHIEFLVGDLKDRAFELPAHVTVVGAMKVVEAPTNRSSSILFMVMDAENYQRWISGQEPTFILSGEREGESEYAFELEKEGLVYFVFDNRAALFKKYVTFSVAYEETITTSLPDPRVTYVAWGLLIMGALVVAYGLVRKAPIPWS